MKNYRSTSARIITLMAVLLASINSYSQVKQLWGMTSDGGEYHAGTIFRTDGDGSNLMLQNSFFQYEGTNPCMTNFVEASDGKLYGLTSTGGVNNLGILFQYDPATNSYVKKVDFAGTSNGSYPKGSLMLASDGNLYGVTYQGGTSNYGVVFQYNPLTNVFTKEKDFDGIGNGAYPWGSLMQANDGNMYGMAYQGGSHNKGTLFQYNPTANTLISKIDFAGAANGSNPYGSLIQATDGMLYGMTYFGGTNNLGVLFQYNTITSVLTKQVDFAGASNGSLPYGSLLQAIDGNLYGMTYQGGFNNKGVLFHYNAATSTYTKDIDFAGANGANPKGSLMQSTDGKLYGMTYQGGTVNNGLLFQYDPTTNTCTKKVDFTGAVNGSYPWGTLMQAADGNLYGMTYQGGTDAKGVVFQYNATTNTFAKKIDMQGSTIGDNPQGSLTLANDGNLYGVTYAGGANNLGALFQYNPATQTITKKYDFTGGNNGNNPYGNLIQAADGKLYGMTHFGGTNSVGILFQYDPTTDIYTKKKDFTSATTGSNPFGSLMLASDGMLYAISYGGGANNLGVLFQYNTTTNVITKKIDFAGTTNGSNPYGTLTQASDGYLYGMTYSGGANNLGVLFQYDPIGNTLTKNIDFAGTTNGSNPQGSLIQASNGLLFGTTTNGGANNKGVLFQYNPLTASFIKNVDFAGTSNGSNPQGSLIQASNGMLYGMTNTGGPNNYGVLFEWNPTANTFAKKFDFNSANGMNPAYTQLTEITVSINTSPVLTSICPGNNIDVPYTVLGTYNSGNVFSAQLSDAAGSFASPLTIGTLSSTFAGTIACTIPYLSTSSTNYRIRVVSTNPAVIGSTNGTDITVLPKPVGVVTNIAVCSGSTTNLLLNSSITGSTFTWTSSLTSGTASGNSNCSIGCSNVIADLLINPNNVHADVSYLIIPTSPQGCVGNSFTNVVTITAIPASPLTITGPTVVCNMSTTTYSTAVIPEATSYVWTVPTGMTITSGQGTTAIAVNLPAGTLIGTLSVAANNGCGNSVNTASINITKKPQAPNVILGPVSLCGVTTANYTIAVITGASTYNWILPSGITIASGTGTTAVRVNIATSFVTGNIGVSAANTCGSSTVTTLTVFGKVPSIPTNITGATNVCGLSTITYTATGVSGATGYTWTLPTGFTQLSATGNTITVQNSGFTTGSISAKGTNLCGAGAVKTVTLTIAAATPGVITGPTVTCGMTTAAYSIAAVTGATSYIWTVPAGVTLSTGQGTTTIEATFSTPFVGNVSVIANNGCVNSSTRTLAVTKIPATPAAIAGPSVVCGLGTAAYSIPAVNGATNYLWVLQAGMSFVSGQGTPAIVVNIATPITAGQVKVYAQNTCGNSALQSKAFGACASSLTMNTDNETVFTLYPNPATEEFTINFIAENDAVFTLELYDVLGNKVIEQEHSVSAGESAIKTNVKELKSGVYFMRLTNANNTVIYTKKVVKE